MLDPLAYRSAWVAPLSLLAVNTLWGAFLYWWAGIIYAIETVRVVRVSRVSPPPASDTLEQGG